MLGFPLGVVQAGGALAPDYGNSFDHALGSFLSVIYDGSFGLLDTSQALGRGGVLSV